MAQRPAEVTRLPGHTRRVRPLEILCGRQQFLTLVSMGKRTSARSGNKGPAVFIAQKRRTQGSVLRPMKEVVSLLLVHHLFLEIGHGLAAADLDLTRKTEPRYRQLDRHLQDCLWPLGLGPHVMPKRDAGFTVNGQPLLGLLLRWPSKIIKAKVVAGDSRQQLAGRRGAVLGGVNVLAVKIGLDPLPRRIPERINLGET